MSIKTNFVVPFSLTIATILSVPIVTGEFAVALGQSADQLYKDAISADERGDASRAISLYEQLVGLQPNSVPVRSNLGAALARVGRYADAVRQYQEALKRDPKNSIVRINLALAWYKQGEFDKTASELQSERKDHPENQQSLYLLADCYLRLGRNLDAIKLLEPEYQANPDDRAADYALGTALIRDGQIQRGELVIDRILRDGNTAESRLLMGEAQFAAGDYKAASASLRQALEMNPRLPSAWSLYGRALLGNQDSPGAKNAFQRALELDGNDFAANLYLGAVLRVEGNSLEAAPYIKRALQLRPASPEARFQAGALAAVTGKLDEARKELEELEKKWPDFLEVHVQLAAIYARLNLQRESQHERQVVLQLNEKARDKKAPTAP
jgi:tetratricopeptide (TPR) repeat protein